MQSKKAHILLVEDEMAHAELIRRAFALRTAHMSLTYTTSLKQARAVLEASMPDLIITDLLLPDGNGIALLPAVKGPSAYPVIVMTSHGDEHVAVDAMRAGALDYIVKTEETLADMPHVAERALREWRHINERRLAEDAAQQARETLYHQQQREKERIEQAFPFTPV